MDATLHAGLMLRFHAIAAARATLHADRVRMFLAARKLRWAARCLGGAERRENYVGAFTT
jgi:hypothetical protein